MRYCSHHEGAGCSIGTPWGSSYIVLNADGLNTDVVAHELCHAELFERLGWWTTTRQIPQWFNEGLALMVDYRFVASTDSLQRYQDYAEECLYLSRGGQFEPSLEEISTMRGFFKHDDAYVMLAYMTAGREVSRWLSKVGKTKVAELTHQIKQGNSFAKTYKTLEGNKKQHNPTESAKEAR